MGLLQAAYETYEKHAHLAGVAGNSREPLSPIYHAIQNAQLEITIGLDGQFQSAAPVSKNDAKTIIPVTRESAGRVSDNVKAHPLCDQVRYLAPYGAGKYEAYLAQLARWAQSEYTHPKIKAVLKYIQNGTIVADLAAAELAVIQENGKPDCETCMVRWRVIPAPEGEKSACWEDSTLFQSYINFYTDECADVPRDICQITGKADMTCEMHPKGIVAISYGAKLMSGNDSAGFTYRGRFSKSSEAYNVGYNTSQKAHSALRWLTGNYGVIMGGRTFICWNPVGKPVPQIAFFNKEKDEKTDIVAYKRQLKNSLSGYRQDLEDTDDVIIAALDAATTGRLSVTYYNELKASDFLYRLESWYESCCWDSIYWGIWSPSIKRVIDCAFGTQRKDFVEAEEALIKEHTQRILRCIVDQQQIPFDIVHALAVKASTPLAYKAGNREVVLATACAMIRKYKNDKINKEEWKLALDTTNTDRSYLFGRLLAVAEQVERRTYDWEKDEGRETNAMRMQSVFSQRPMYAWRILEEKLGPYYQKLRPGQANFFRNLTGEIVDMLPGQNTPELGKKLSETYLLGYYLQRSVLTKKKEKQNGEDNENA